MSHLLGRSLADVFEDGQSDPRQSVAIAQKFVADPPIVIELGDVVSPASIAVSPIHRLSQADSQPLLADLDFESLGNESFATR